MKAFAGRMADRLGRLTKDNLTGPDGVTFAFGRCAAVALGAAHVAGVTGIAAWSCLAHAPSLTDAAAFVAGVGGTYPLVTEGLQRLVRLTNCSEPPADPPG